jgi:hypothetical protein
MKDKELRELVYDLIMELNQKHILKPDMSSFGIVTRAKSMKKVKARF